MVHVRIAGLSLDPRTNQPVLILRPIAGPYLDRLLPIWIGHAEATAILLAVEGTEMPRPMTHDLLASVLDTLDTVLQRVEVTRVDDGTFYAALVLRGEERTLVVDARPSDSIALAVRTNSPIFVAEEVLAEASVPQSIIEGDEGEQSEEDTIQQFKQFLEHVDPEDFQE